jgi:hypothetical protein
MDADGDVDCVSVAVHEDIVDVVSVLAGLNGSKLGECSRGSFSGTVSPVTEPTKEVGRTRRTDVCAIQAIRESRF